MATIAEQLRQAREARQLTVEQVADITKMRTDHVRALEEGNYACFAAPVYIRGFVRTYGNLLKLDVPALMATLDAELGSAAHPSALHSAGPSKGLMDEAMLHLTKVDWKRGMVGLVAIGAVSLLAIGWFSWKQYHRSDPLRDLKPGVYQPAQKRTGETLPLPTNPPVRDRR